MTTVELPAADAAILEYEYPPAPPPDAEQFPAGLRKPDAVSGSADPPDPPAPKQNMWIKLAKFGFGVHVWLLVKVSETRNCFPRRLSIEIAPDAGIPDARS
tara:strand:+ start:1412 stop:1714 length:303 start_codon:yes stop_codon:yes gene_type:complete